MGTPIGAGPGTDSEKPGLEAGDVVFVVVFVLAVVLGLAWLLGLAFLGLAAGFGRRLAFGV